MLQDHPNLLQLYLKNERTKIKYIVIKYLFRHNNCICTPDKNNHIKFPLSAIDG